MLDILSYMCVGMFLHVGAGAPLGEAPAGFNALIELSLS